MTTTRRTDTPSTVRPAVPPAFALHTRVLTALAAVSILGAAGCAGSEAEAPAAENPVAESSAAEETSAAAPATSTAPASGAPSEAAAAETTYEDGEYTQTGAYQSPAGEEEVGVTLTLEADVVTAVTVEPMPDNPTTEQYQGRFAGGISDAIVGQKLDDLAVERVAGSSLTSGGFNDAVDKIKSEAQA